MKCNLCEKEYPSPYYFVSKDICIECFKKMSPEKQEEIRKLPDFQSYNYGEKTTSESGKTAISILKFFAWFDFIVSIIGAIWIWSEFGSISKTGGYLYSYTEKVANPIGIGIGIAVLLQGVFICAFFLVIATIAENIIAIRKNIVAK